MPAFPTSAAVFVAGTDTEVGKTFCAAALLAAFAAVGIRAVGYKPVASGVDASGQNEDVRILQAASAIQNDGQHNGYAFATATAPHLAARDQGLMIDTGLISRQLHGWRHQADLVLVEGAGGWHTPLNDAQNLSDWVVAERLPVLLVVGMKLGAINHALLTAQAVAAAGLPLLGWIANCVTPQPHRLDDYVASLRKRLAAPLLGVLPYAPEQLPAQLSTYLDISRLRWPPMAGQPAVDC